MSFHRMFTISVASVKAQFEDQPTFTVQNLKNEVIHLQPNLIRVSADEVTYPLHIIMRYELEKALFNNEITVGDLPEC